MEGRIISYKDLIVWQKAVDLTVEIYNLTKDFPTAEQYGLTSQMRRAAVSIASNIAEGKTRRTQKDFHNFLGIAFASAAELETQLIIAKRLSYGKNEKYIIVDSVFSEVVRMLNSIFHKTSSSN
jgi:four helix bundle protein